MEIELLRDQLKQQKLLLNQNKIEEVIEPEISFEKLEKLFLVFI